MGWLMLVLGLNKQLDLQSLLTEVGRALARAEGWYGQRRVVQGWFIALILAAMCVTLMAGAVALLSRRWSSRWKGCRLALLGAGLLLVYVAFRAVSFHHADRWLAGRIAGARRSWILELAGIGCIALSALRAGLLSRRRD